jgi:glycosyltransferase involved in cell wall biosynthesis
MLDCDWSSDVCSSDLSFAGTTWPWLRQQKFDGVILVKPYDIPLALMLRRASGAKVCYFSGGGEYFTGYQLLVGQVDYLCGCSKHDSDEINKKTGVKCHVNHYGVDSALFTPLAPDAELAASLGLEPGGKTIASAVRLVAQKDLDTGLKAFALAKQKHPDLRFIIAGGGPKRGELEALARELGVAAEVIFAGEMDHNQLPRFYSLADLALFPSQNEPLGIAVGEAMACGLPVVASRVGGIPEQVVEGTGLLCPVRDVQAFAQALTSLLDGQDLKAMGLAARRQIESHFTWEQCVDRIVSGLDLTGL